MDMAQAQGTPLGPLDPTVDVSVIIVTWNTQELLRDCLASLGENTGATRIESIVVDNASTDGSPEQARPLVTAYMRVLGNGGGPKHPFTRA